VVQHILHLMILLNTPAATVWHQYHEYASPSFPSPYVEVLGLGQGASSVDLLFHRRGSVRAAFGI